MHNQFEKFRQRLGDDHWRVMRGMMTVGFFVLIGKFAGAGKEIVIAWRYGVGDIVDVYVLAFVLVNWAPSVLASTLNSVYVPLIRRLPMPDKTAFSAELLAMAVLIGTLLSLTIGLLITPMLPQLVDGLNETAQSEIVLAGRWMAPTVLLMCVCVFLSSRLLAQERHVNTLLDSVPALVIMLVVLSIALTDSVVVLAASTLLGQLLQLLALLYISARSGMPLQISFSFRHDAWRGFLQSFGLLAVGTFIMSAVPLIDQFLAVRLEGGAVSTLSYASRLLALGLGLGATAISRAVLPVLSDEFRSQPNRIKLANRWSLILLVIGVVGAAVAWVLSPYVVAVLFERGAFSAQDTSRVSEVMRYGLTQLPFYLSSIVLVQLFASLGAYRTMVISAVLAVISKLVSGYFLSEHFGVAGISLSTGVMYSVNAVYFIVCMNRLSRS